MLIGCARPETAVTTVRFRIEDRSGSRPGYEEAGSTVAPNHTPPARSAASQIPAPAQSGNAHAPAVGSRVSCHDSDSVLLPHVRT